MIKKKAWEEIDDDTSRLEVIGGWIVRYNPIRPAMVFVPDKYHNWEI